MNNPNQPTSPASTTDPAREGGGGDPAASALAFRIVSDATFDSELARRVRQALGGDSDAEAALKLGVSAALVRRACRDGRPTPRLLCRVCVVYGVDGHWLLTGQGAATRAASNVDHAAPGELLETIAQRLVQMIHVLDAARAARAGHGDQGSPSTTNPQGQEYL